MFLLFWGILYVVFWSHWPSPPVSSRSTSHSILTKLCVLILKKLVLPINSWVCDAQLQCVHLTGGHTLKESSVSLFLQLSVITNSSLSGGTSWPCDFSVMGSGLARAWAGLCAVSQPLWVRVCNCPAMSKTHFHYRHPPPLSLTIFFSLPSSEMIPEPWEKEACYKCPTYPC